MIFYEKDGRVNMCETLLQVLREERQQGIGCNSLLVGKIWSVDYTKSTGKYLGHRSPLVHLKVYEYCRWELLLDVE